MKPCLTGICTVYYILSVFLELVESVLVLLNHPKVIPPELILWGSSRDSYDDSSLWWRSSASIAVSLVNIVFG